MAGLTNNTQNNQSGVQWLTITSEQHGQRLDNFLFSRLKSVPKSLIYKTIRSGNVRVNKGRVKPNYRLQADDVVRVPPFRVSERAEHKPSSQLLELLKEQVIYEDEHFIGLDKPYGLAVHAGSGVAVGVIEAMRVLYSQLPGLQLVHRLDRETSGCLLLAKDRQSLLAAQQAFISGTVTKRYFALTQDHWAQRVTVIDQPLTKHRPSSGEHLVEVDEAGKQSLTEFHVLRTYPMADLVEVSLYTGRTHQIRVHAQQAGHALAGDPKYGVKSFNQLMKKFDLSRLFLHAAQLELELVSGGRLVIKATLATELQQVLDNLEAK